MQLAALATSPRDNVSVFREYSNLIMAVPGVGGTGWSRSKPNEIYVRVPNEEMRFLADAVLADAIDGVNIVFEVEDAASTLPANSWTKLPFNVARAMAALPGVVQWKAMRNLYVLGTDTRERSTWLWKAIEHTVHGKPLASVVVSDMP